MLFLGVAMDRLDDPLLFLGSDADGFERLPGSAIGTDEGFVVRP